METATIPIPSAEEVRTALERFNLKQLEELAKAADVPFTTLYKIAKGKTRDPGIKSVRKLWPHIDAVRHAAEQGAE